jgi:hypothetical protein
VKFDGGNSDFVVVMILFVLLIGRVFIGLGALWAALKLKPG